MSDRAAELEARDPPSRTFASAEARLRDGPAPHPVYLFHPGCITRAVERFSALAATPIFAVKANPHPWVIAELVTAGVRRFDVASIAEVEHVARLVGPAAELWFMNSIRSVDAAQRAHFDHGVRHFVVESLADLARLKDALGSAAGETMALVRVKPPKAGGQLDLGTKFGVSVTDARRVLDAARQSGFRAGVSFHVGSQCWDPMAFVAAVEAVRPVLDDADCLDLGGGFPQPYVDDPAVDWPAYFAPINAVLATLPEHLSVVCEPGRALVAESMSSLVRIERVEGDRLYLNEGVYGGLFEAKVEGIRYPVRVYRDDARIQLSGSMPYAVFGPTCDSYDALDAPYLLPQGLQVGDTLEFAAIGAYSWVFKNRFNGFSAFEVARIAHISNDLKALQTAALQHQPDTE